MKIFERIVKILSIVFIILFLVKFVYYLILEISLFWNDDPWADFFIGVTCFYNIKVALMGIVSYFLLIMCTVRMSKTYYSQTYKCLGVSAFISGVMLTLSYWLSYWGIFNLSERKEVNILGGIWLACLVVCIVLLIVYKIKTRSHKAVAEMAKLKED